MRAGHAAVAVTRRAALLGTAGVAVAAGEARAQSGDVPFSFACRLYDRMLPLYTGAVKIPGVNLNFMPNADHRDVFDRMEKRLEFDASELSFSDFITFATSGKPNPLVALPVFPSRVFRHGYIFVNKRANIAGPKQLEGRRIGITRWGETAVVWCRGMMQDEYGLDLTKVAWVTGAVNAAGAHGTPPAVPELKAYRIENNDSDRSLSQLLEAGSIDAIIGAYIPEAFGRNPDIVRLLPDYRGLEKDWYRRTRLYPIMHVIAMRQDVHDRNPGLANRFAQALQQSKLQALADMEFTASLVSMQPWLQSDIEEWQAVFGADPFPYGIEANRPTIDASMRYMAEQGLIATALPAERLFVPVDLG